MVKLLDVRKSFETSPFFAAVGFEIVYFEEGNVCIRLPISNKLFNANKTVHGGVYATMLDTIMGMTIRSITKTRCSTISLNIHYLASATDGEIFAKGKVIQQGYRIVTAEAEVLRENGEILTKGVGTFKLIRDK